MRRMPGYRYARRAVLPRIRQSTGARSLVKRVFDVDAAQPAPLDVAAGNVIGGVGTERLPVVVVLLLGIPAERIERLVDEIAQLQLLSAGFRPVIVMEVPALAAARRYGYPVELLITADDWRDVHQSWETYARLKLARILNTYRSAATVTIREDGIDEASRLILTSCAPTS